MYIQMIGRVLRPYENKEYATIIDHSGAVYTHGFVEKDIEWNLDPKKPLTIKERKKARDQPEVNSLIVGLPNPPDLATDSPNSGEKT